MTTLANLKPGQNATIRSLEGPDVVVGRLLEMGLTEGEPVEVLAVAPLGDPIEIRVRSYQLSLRKSEARMVVVG